MPNFHYLNGRWVATENLKISALDLVVTRGFGVFDFLRTYQRQQFRLQDHLERFFRSAKLLHLKIPKPKKEIEKIIFAGIKKNPDGELNIKIILTGGETEDGITPISSGLLIVIFNSVSNYPRKFYEKGVKVITVRGSRFLPQAKYLNYTQAVLAMMKAKEQGAEEALYVDEKGRITEATRCNFFAVIRGKLVTPKEGVLLGITRKVVLELARKLKIPVVERNLFLREIKDSTETFLTASNREIMPVVKIDEEIVDKGKVGKVTRKLMESFREISNNKNSK